MTVAYAKTDPGCVREQNEDVVVVDPQLRFALVADGVGGRHGGDVAARQAATSIHAVLREREALLRSFPHGPDLSSADVERMVGRALDLAQSDIHEASRTHPDWKGMATTVVLALAFEDRFLVAHVGDSRAYLLRGAQVFQLTADHVRTHGAEVEADTPALERALGARGRVEASLEWIRRQPGDMIILCSDGLSDTLSTARELTHLRHRFSPQQIPEVLVDLARTRGGPDNIGVAVLADEDGDAAPLSELRYLRRVPMLRALSLLELGQIRELLRDEAVDANQVLSGREGLAFVSKGRVQITRSGVSRVIAPGGVLGECSVTWGGPWPYDARTMEPTILTFVPQQALSRILQSSPEAPQVLWHLLQDTTEKLLSWTARPGEEVAQ